MTGCKSNLAFEEDFEHLIRKLENRREGIYARFLLVDSLCFQVYVCAIIKL